jgi:hypothetical protein
MAPAEFGNVLVENLIIQNYDGFYRLSRIRLPIKGLESAGKIISERPRRAIKARGDRFYNDAG